MGDETMYQNLHGSDGGPTKPQVVEDGAGWECNFQAPESDIRPVTPDERRRVAAALREHGQKRLTTNDALAYVPVIVRVFDEGGELLKRLADLMDPTCEVVGVEPMTYGEFDQTMGYDFHLSCGHHVCEPYEDEPPSYCDQCGRRVVAREDE